MLSIRPEDSWGWRSQRRLSLSIMQYTYVPPHALIHFSATSDMEDPHLGFPLIYSGSRGDGPVWAGWTHSNLCLQCGGTCHSHESACWMFSRLDLIDAKGTRYDSVWQPGADLHNYTRGCLHTQQHKAARSILYVNIFTLFFLLQVLSLPANAVNCGQFAMLLQYITSYYFKTKREKKTFFY